MPAADQLYSCDCCAAEVPRDQIAVVIAYGIETAACCACRGVELEDEPEASDLRVIGSLAGIVGQQ